MNPFLSLCGRIDMRIRTVVAEALEYHDFFL
jgi:hypothetical protein